MKREEIDALWRDPANWTLGLVYRCREDPRAIVPRRWRWGGWTLNFAHPRAALVGLAALALAVGPGLLALALSGDVRIALGAMVLSICALMAWASLESARGE